MKVAINVKHGGFGISGDGLKRYIELGGAHVSVYENKGWPGGSKELQRMHDENMSRLVDLGDGFSKVANPGLFYGDNLYKDGMVYSYDGRKSQRHENILIQTIEELGESANGSHATLKVVEVPDGVEYQIEDYDGLEWIAEKHRTWS